jgi:hypothetical protein
MEEVLDEMAYGPIQEKFLGQNQSGYDHFKKTILWDNQMSYGLTQVRNLGQIWKATAISGRQTPEILKKACGSFQDKVLGPNLKRLLAILECYFPWIIIRPMAIPG